MALTFRNAQGIDGGSAGPTVTSSAISIGTASSDRWVLLKCAVSLNNASDFTVEIGGVSASLVGTSFTSGSFARVRTYKANVTTGTTATVDFIGDNGSGDAFFNVDMTAWTEDAGEPTLNDQEIDLVPFDTLFEVAVDIPDGGLAIGMTFDKFATNNVTWTGLTEVADLGTRSLSAASDDGMTLETGRAITADFSVLPDGFQCALFVTSFNAPSAGGVTVALDAGSYSRTGNALTLTTATGVALDAGAYSFTGQPTAETFGFSIPLDAGSYSRTGNNLAVQLSIPVSLDTGSYAFTGRDLGVAAGLTVALDAGSYSITGRDLALATNTAIPLNAGSYSFTGLDIAVQEGVNIALDSGAYSLAGQNLTATTSIAVSLDAGSYTLTGLDLDASTGQIIALDAGTYSLSGRDLAVQSGISVSLATGVYSFTGFNVTSVADGQSVARVAGFVDSKTGGVLSDSLRSGSFTNTPNGGTLTEARNV